MNFPGLSISEFEEQDLLSDSRKQPTEDYHSQLRYLDTILGPALARCFCVGHLQCPSSHQQLQRAVPGLSLQTRVFERHAVVCQLRQARRWPQRQLARGVKQQATLLKL